MYALAVPFPQYERFETESGLGDGFIQLAIFELFGNPDRSTTAIQKLMEL